MSELITAQPARTPKKATLENQLQDLLVRKGIRQITMMNDGQFSIVRIGYAQRGFGVSLSEAYADCKGPLQ